MRVSGKTEQIPAAAEMTFVAGDRFIVETPGGGGFGSVSAADARFHVGATSVVIR